MIHALALAALMNCSDVSPERARLNSSFDAGGAALSVAPRLYPYNKLLVLTRSGGEWHTFTTLGVGLKLSGHQSLYVERKFSLDPSPNVTEIGWRLNWRN